MRRRFFLMAVIGMFAASAAGAWVSKKTPKKVEEPAATEGIAETTGAAETAPESAPTEMPESLPEPSPSTMPATAPAAPETAPETIPEIAPTLEAAPPAAAAVPTDEVGVRSPPATGAKKGVAYAAGNGCVARPEGTPGGWSLFLEFLSGDGEVCGVTLDVRNVQSKTVFSSKVQSSWIYLDLPPGGYEVRAKTGGKERKFSTQTSEGKFQKGRLFFDAR